MNSTQTKSFLLLFKYSFLIILATCLPLGECLYIPPVWLTSSYLQADSCKIISTRTGNDSTPTATLLFRTSFSQTPNIGYGISSYQGADYLGEQFFQVYSTNLDQSSLSLGVQILGITSIWTMEIRYIAIDKAFPHRLNSFDNVPVNYGTGSLVNITSQQPGLTTYQNVINFTSQSIASGQSFIQFQQPLYRNKILLFLTSMYQQGTYDPNPPYNPIQIRLFTEVLTNQTYKIKVTLGINVKITRLHYSIIIFDQTDVLSSGFYELFYQKVELPATGGFFPVPQNLKTNLIMGLVQFTTQRTKTVINFGLVFNKNSLGQFGVSFPYTAPKTPSVNALSYGFTVFYIKTWRCPYYTVYNTQTGLCELCMACSSEPIQCGDGIYVAFEECDDGNRQNGDGCSFDCTIEPDYHCEINDDISMKNSVCYYMGAIQFQILYIEKLDSTNQINIVLKIGNPSLWKGADLADMVSLPNMTGFNSYSVSMNTDGTVSIIADYNTNIQNLKVTVKLEPVKSGRSSLQRVDSISKTFEVIPNDNEVAAFYEESTYSIANFISILSYMIAAFSIALVVLGIFSGKLVAVQMMAVMQISYLSLLTIKEINPCFKALTNIWFINGFNYYALTKNYLMDALSPIKIKGIFLYSQFFQNYNFTFILVLIPMTVALGFLILSKTVFKAERKKMVKMGKLFMGQYAFYALMLSGYIIFVSFAIQVVYGVRNMSDGIGPISITESIVLLIIFAVYFFLLRLQTVNFGEFKSYFIDKNKPQNNQLELDIQNTEAVTAYTQRKLKIKLKITDSWYNILIIQRFFVGIWLVFMLNSTLNLIFPIAILSILTLLAFFIRPYAQQCHNLRYICNMIITIIILCIYLSYSALKQIDQQIGQSQIWIYMPMAVCLLQIICVIYNFIFTLRCIVIVLNAREQRQGKADYNESQLNQINGYASQHIENLKNSSSIADVLKLKNKLKLDSFNHTEALESCRYAKQQLNGFKKEMEINKDKSASKNRPVELQRYTITEYYQNKDKNNIDNSHENGSGNTSNYSSINKLIKQYYQCI